MDGDRAYRELIYWLAIEDEYYSVDKYKGARMILDDMVRSLVFQARESLRLPIRAALTSLPCHNRQLREPTRLHVEDILRDALAGSGVQLLRIVPYSIFGEPLMYPENSQVAGHGPVSYTHLTLPTKRIV